jgi:hypothetical protein
MPLGGGGGGDGDGDGAAARPMPPALPVLEGRATREVDCWAAH